MVTGKKEGLDTVAEGKLQPGFVVSLLLEPSIHISLALYNAAPPTILISLDDLDPLGLQLQCAGW